MARNDSTRVTKADEELLADWREVFEPARREHEKLEKHWKRWRKAYRGVVEDSDRVFNNTLKPKHVYQIVELIAANIIDDQPKSRVIPEGPMDVDGAAMLEQLLDEQHRRDSRDEKLGQWVKQAIETNLSPAKIGWEIRSYDKKYRVFDELGQETLGEKNYVEFDQPTFVPIPVDDFFFDPAGFRPDEWNNASQRTWHTIDELKQEEEKGRFRNIRLVADTQTPEAPQQSATLKLDRTGRVEVIETWFLTPDGLRMITVANKTTVIRDELNLFWHGKLPFILATAIPDMNDPFSFSVVESIAEDADVYARFLQQMLDNAEHINNGIVVYDVNSIDKERLSSRPGTAIGVEGMGSMDSIKWVYPPTSILDSSQGVLESILNNMRDISGAPAYLSGASDQGINQDTATGISLIQNLAQRRMLLLKNTVAQADRRGCQMEIELNKQLMKKPVVVPKPKGMDQWEFKQIADPQTISECEARYEVEDAAKNLDKQKARDEAMMLLQTWEALAAALNMPGSGVWANLEPPARLLLDAFDIKDADAWLIETQPQPIAIPQQPTLPPGGGTGFPPSGGNAPAPTTTPLGAAGNGAPPPPPAPIGANGGY